MKWNRTTRRHFLQGAGKTGMILPFLPSLMPEKEARAQAAARQKTFIGIAMQHGMANMYSASDGAASVYMPMLKNMQAFQPPGRHLVHHKTLDAAKTDGGGQISEVFDAAFNPYLAKMNMMQGLDFFPFLWAHHSAHFGNPATALTAGDPPLRPAHAGIDQVMAYSPNFYKSAALLGKSVCWTGNFGEFNYFGTHTFADPANKKTSAIAGVNASYDPQQLWDAYFKNFTGGGPPPPPPPGPTLRQKMADHVLLDYKAFVANPRLGKDDRLRVEQHISLLNETQKSLASMNQMMTVVSCDTAPAKPAVYGTPVTDPPWVRTRTLGYDVRKQMLQATNNVIVSLIACGLVHSFTSHFNSYLSDDPEKWHAWAHSGAPEHKQQTSAILHDIVLDLVRKLDQNGLLDSSLVMVPQEHNQAGHQAWNANMVTFGSAGGVLKTGQYLDYRNMTGYGNDTTHQRFGFPMTQAFANILMAMDVPASEYEALNRDNNTHFSPSTSGYGSSVFAPDTQLSLLTRYAAFKGSNLSDWLPLIKA